MKNFFYITILALLIQSCGKSGLSTVVPSYPTKSYLDRGVKLVPKVYTYEVADFDIYVYNICQKIGKGVDNERFCSCPDDFFNGLNTKIFKKVEEIYLLKHRNTDLVLYLTTFSHKYIKEGRGFLNDPRYYKDKIVLDQIEYVYIGQLIENQNIIHFPNVKNNQDIILHFDYKQYQIDNKLMMLEGNIATAENRYNVYEPINLTGIFSDTISYKHSPNYSIDFYKNNGCIGSSDCPVKNIKTINIISRKGKTEIIFIPSDPKERLYKIASKRIKYAPNFYLIDH